MSAPVLSISEQKAAVSGKKKKKKTLKNVLGIPSSLKVESHLVEVHEAEKLNKILERLLPSARLPVQQNMKSKDSGKQMISDLEQIAEIKKKRNQLSLGVNALSRNIKKELISAVLLAADIQPKFLVHHLNLLCTQNKIPFLHLPGLRNITKNNLGFPCIAVGFMKNYSDFSEAIEEIKVVSENLKIVTSDKKQESLLESSSEESEEEKETYNENAGKRSEIPFTYLMRSSIKERIFIPEKYKEDETKQKDIIMLDKDDSKIKMNQEQLGISSNLTRKRKSKLVEIEVKDAQRSDVDDDNDEEYGDLEVPKKKAKKDWVIDKVGSRPSYYPASLMRVPLNPDRHKKK